MLLLRADGSVLVGFGAVPEDSKGRVASISGLSILVRLYRSYESHVESWQLMWK